MTIAESVVEEDLVEESSEVADLGDHITVFYNDGNGREIGIGTILFVILTGPVLARTLPPMVRFMGTDVIQQPTGIVA